MVRKGGLEPPRVLSTAPTRKLGNRAERNSGPLSDVLRHTALTQLADAGCDVFTLARIFRSFLDHDYTSLRVPAGRLDWTGIPSGRKSSSSQRGYAL